MAIDRRSSDQIVQPPNFDNGVLLRGRVTLLTANQGSGSIYAPYYYAEKTIDITFLNTDGIFPKTEVWRKDNGAGGIRFTQAPYAFVEAGTNTLAEYVRVSVEENVAKDTGYTLGVTIALWSDTQNTEREFYFTVTDLGIGSNQTGEFYNYGTFS